MTMAILVSFLFIFMINLAFMIPYLLLEKNTKSYDNYYVLVLSTFIILDYIFSLNLKVISLIKLSLYCIFIYKMNLEVFRFIKLRINKKILVFTSFVIVFLLMFLRKHYEIIFLFQIMYFILLTIFIYKRRLFQFELRMPITQIVVYFSILTANAIIIK